MISYTSPTFRAKNVKNAGVWKLLQLDHDGVFMVTHTSFGAGTSGCACCGQTDFRSRMSYDRETSPWRHHFVCYSSGQNPAYRTKQGRERPMQAYLR